MIMAPMDDPGDSCACTTERFTALVNTTTSSPPPSDTPTPRPGFMASPEVKKLSETQKIAKSKAQAVVTLLKSKR